MQFRFGISALIAVALSTPVAAADLGFGELAGSGRLAITTHSGAAAGVDLSGDGQLDFGLGAGFGIELGVLGIATRLGDNVDTPHETYGALTWRGGGVEIAAGVVRPAYDAVVISPLERLAPWRGLSARHMAQTRSRVTWGAAYAGGLPEGIRVSGAGGGMQWAISAHRMGDVRVGGASLGWTAGDLEAAIAAEWASDGEFGAKLGLRHSMGNVTAGVAGYLSPAPGYGDLAEAYLDWRASDRLTLSALLQAPAGSAGPSLALIGGEWQLGTAASALMSLSREGGDNAASLGLDFRF